MKWDLTYLYKTTDDFNKDFGQAVEMIDGFKEYQGKLHDETSFKNYFLKQKEFEKKAYRAFLYAHLNNDLNKKDPVGNELFQKVQIAFARVTEVLSFEDPEILNIGEKIIFGFIDRNPELEELRFRFQKLFKRQEHILDKKSEGIIAQFNQLAGAGRELYSALCVADVEHGDVMLDSGEIVTITNSNYRAYIKKSANALERKEIFESVYSYFDLHKNTYATIYKNVLDADFAEMKIRKYNSSLDSYLFNNQIPTDVYHSLMKVARNHTASLKKYYELRKEYLNLETHHTYDRFLDLAQTNTEYSFEEARKLFFASIDRFPETFKDKAYEVLKDGFVDVYEKEGKRTGAYSSSMPDIHPYILLNFSGNLEDVFTVAHEAGHSIHSMFSAETQPSSLQNYTIFVAEVASTFNEHNLLDYFIQTGQGSREEKITLLQRAIDDISATFFRQTLFAIYEYESHKLVENNQPITVESLSKIMIDLYKEFYDIDITLEELKPLVWAYIPHLFYTPFYVYQYATSFAASLKIYEDVKSEKEGAFEKYLNLLRSGGSQYPIKQLQNAGVDLTKEDAFMAVVHRMDDLVNQLELALKSK